MRAACAIVVAGLAGLLAGCGGSSAGTHSFVAGTGGVGCELAADVPELGTFAYCLVAVPDPVSVTMDGTGHLDVCRGVRCMSNAPEDAVELPRGESIDAGPFRCTSLADGVRCVVVGLGRGFLLAPGALKRL